ncbi:hypothetical protein G6011_06729 [Alternaria panax]|uniref:Uncharacterized protein n=1 Tax=Alternaria panax TaxID=48097 RepID=A0AAD4FHS7_9PLEO|nr:hypothetical protein G6011_06729 [Alternaria panax]
MPVVFTLVTLIACASAAPIPAPAPEPPAALPLITLSLIGSHSHYTLGSSQKPQLSTSSDNAWSIHIPMDVSLDLSTRPEYVQAIEVIGVESGEDLHGGAVAKDDGGVLCKVNLRWGSGGVIVGMGKGRMLVDGGRVGRVTGVSCWKERV